MNNTSKSGKDSISSLFKLLERVNSLAENEGRSFYRAFITMLISLTTLVLIGCYANIHGFLTLNIFFAVFVFVFVILTITHPKLLVLIFNIDIVTRLAPDTLDTEGNIFDVFLRISRKIAGLFMAFFLFLGIFPIAVSPKIFFVGMVACVVVLVLKVQGKVGTVVEKMTGLIAGICFGYILFCNIGSNSYVQTSLDRVFGAGFSRSLHIESNQVTAHQATERIDEWNHYACLDKKDVRGEKKTRKETWNWLIQNSNLDPLSPTSRLNEEQTNCLRKIQSGRASFTDIVGKKISSIRENFTTTVFEGNIFPQLGGAFVTRIDPKFKYTITVSGIRKQYSISTKNGKGYFSTVTADGRFTKHGYKTWIDQTPAYRRQLINPDKPALISTFVYNGKNYFAENGTVVFNSTKPGNLLLTINCQQISDAFAKSRGNISVKVDRIKI